ncbi:MAG: type II toxin-antitoxin system HicA family toxin [Firmicutes bacterium]|nr:type II toxin-antitoxin system HicA family toxin [Bacillota bacterium]
MSSRQKMLNRLLLRPKDYTYSELRTLLGKLGYMEDNKGKTSGSRVSFYNKQKKVVSVHKPHPGNELKRYVIDLIIDSLRRNGDL